VLLLSADTTSSLWRKALSAVLRDGIHNHNERFCCDSPVALTIATPDFGIADPLFPIPQSNLDIINHYLCTGEREDQVIHEWTKLYRHRIFDAPHSQMERLLNLLRSGQTHSACQISLWCKELDPYQRIAPCVQTLWARKRNEHLEVHVHSHSSDAYGKLLMNLQEFIALQHQIAELIGLKVGTFIYFIDSYHVYHSDKLAAHNLLTSF
jgi:thymidylate synthase